MDFKRSNAINTAAYVLAVAGVLIANAQEIHTLEFVCKPLMMLILSSWFFFNTRRYGDRFTLLIQGGLFFSMVGDIALMFQYKDEFNFLIGLSAFLIAHVCYLLAFARNISESPGAGGWWLSVLLSAVLLVFGWLFSIDLLTSLSTDDVMKIPLVAYAITITTMGIVSSFRYRRTYAISFWSVFGGAVLFILSDALLANLKFNTRPIEVSEAWVMVTYAIAQFLIVAGCMQHVLSPDAIRRKQALSA